MPINQGSSDRTVNRSSVGVKNKAATVIASAELFAPEAMATAIFSLLLA